ncbi:MAG: ISAzo13 family transposase, partial [Bryobacteraceae bacterium]
MDLLTGIKARFTAPQRVLDERSRRLLVAAESQSLGRGGISTVSQATGVSRQVIRQGKAELRRPAGLPQGRIRRPGGGRKKTAELNPALKAQLEELLESTTRGGPESPLRWTCRSVRNLEAELN